MKWLNGLLGRRPASVPTTEAKHSAPSTSFADDIARYETDRAIALERQQTAQRDSERKAEETAAQQAAILQEASRGVVALAEDVLAEYHSASGVPSGAIQRTFVFDLERQLAAVVLKGNVVVANLEGPLGIDSSGKLAMTGTIAPGESYYRIETTFGPADDDRPWKDSPTYYKLIRLASRRDALIALYKALTGR